MNLPKRFEEYWKTSPGFGNLTQIPVSLAKIAASTAYDAGMSEGIRWFKDSLEERLPDTH